MRVAQIEADQAGPFIRRWHYSGLLPRGSHVFFAWIIDNNIYAVADYGSASSPNQARGLARRTNEDVTINNLVELKRLCRVEPKKKVQLSQFLAKCHRILKKIGYKYVVSFSDPEHGHNGGIYRASNFQWLGKTDIEYRIIDQQGASHHRLYALNYAKNNKLSISEARKQLGVKRVPTLPKDRWFFRLHGQRFERTLFTDLDSL